MNCALALSENLAGLPASCQDGFPALSVRLADVFGGTDESGLAEVTRQATSENEFQIRRGLQEISQRFGIQLYGLAIKYDGYDCHGVSDGRC